MNNSNGNTINLCLSVDLSSNRVSVYSFSNDVSHQLGSNLALQQRLFDIDFTDLQDNANQSQLFVKMLFASCTRLTDSKQIPSMTEGGWKYLIDDFRQKAEQGDSKAMYILAGMLAEHAVLLKNLNILEEAQNWFEAAAAHGNENAKEFLLKVWPSAKEFHRKRIEQA